MLTIQPHITKKFTGDIWRLEIDENTSTLLLEIRNEAEKQVYFASINLQSGKINFDNYTLPERWLAGIEGAYNGVLLLHNYQSAGVPVHKAVIAVDEVTGETLWSNYNMAFDHLSVSGPVVYSTQFQPKKLYVNDVHTGTNQIPYNEVVHTELVKNITIPQLIAADALTGLNLPEPYSPIVHYVEYNGRRIVSLHTFDNETLKQHLFIEMQTGSFYEVLLNTDIQKLQPEAFVLHENWLICLKNKTEIIVLKL